MKIKPTLGKDQCNLKLRWAQLFLPVTPAHRSLWWDYHEFRHSLSYKTTIKNRSYFFASMGILRTCMSALLGA